MKYILNPNSPWALNGSLSDNGNGTSNQPVIINPMIEGDKYGFVSSNPNKDMFNAIVTNSESIDVNKAEIQKQAVTFCAKQYPDT